MSAFLNSMGSIGEAYGQAKELQNQENIRTKTLTDKMRLDQGYLQVQQQYAQNARNQFELEQKKYGNGTVDMGLPIMQKDDGTWFQRRLNPAGGAGAFVDIPMPVNTSGPKALSDYIATMPKEIQPRLAAIAKSYIALNPNDFPGAIKGVESFADKYDTQQRTISAANDRQQSSQKFATDQQQRAFGEREKLSASMLGAGKNAVAVNGAMTAVDDIMNNSSVLKNLASAGKISMVIDPQGNLQSLVSRAVPLTDQEAKVASAFSHLTESINTLRGPLGATGFRGPEAWGALQGQRGNPMANMKVTLGILGRTKKALQGIQRANQQMLGPDRMNQILNAPMPGEDTPDDPGTIDFQQ